MYVLIYIYNKRNNKIVNQEIWGEVETHRYQATIDKGQQLVESKLQQNQIKYTQVLLTNTQFSCFNSANPDLCLYATSDASLPHRAYSLIDAVTGNAEHFTELNQISVEDVARRHL